MFRKSFRESAQNYNTLSSDELLPNGTRGKCRTTLVPGVLIFGNSAAISQSTESRRHLCKVAQCVTGFMCTNFFAIAVCAEKPVGFTNRRTGESENKGQLGEAT